MLNLKIGDKNTEGTIEILNEDSLCYLVLSTSRGARGIRTISKALLKEFIEFEAQNPNTDSQTARNVLCGKSSIDKFEYGYCSTLLALAKLNKTLPNRSTNPSINQTNKSIGPLQKITYGAPGTGKSHGTEEKIEKLYPNKEERKLNVFRTTFHPDSDYSTFVGCYKPLKQDSIGILTKDQLIAELKKTKESGVTYPCHRFAIKYWKSLKGISRDEIISILKVSGFTESMNVEIGKCISLGEDEAINGKNANITYNFVPQAFTKAFIRAYKQLEQDKPIFLVIEEINRGNCAQIFGDLFQLLDRDDEGYSKYAIKPDTDLENYLVESLGDKYDVDEGMKLPPNLYIWATMNTSDQSLFPIDSAFKRRWSMKYVPIDPYKENWAIEVGDRKYSWSSFLEKVNFEIGQTTMSEDKKLGFYFCKADKKADETDYKPTIITLENFASKVLFYIYNDVFKDYGLEREFFKDKENDQKIISFESLFDYQGEIKDSVVAKILDNLEVGLMEEEYSNNEDSPRQGGKTHSTCKRVEFPDGTSFEDDNYTQAEILTETISKVGVDRVYDIIGSINIHTDGIYKVVSKETQDGCVKKPTTIGEYYIYPPAGPLCCSFIKKINDKLNLGLIITEK